jgi:hypothetical protein
MIIKEQNKSKINNPKEEEKKKKEKLSDERNNLKLFTLKSENCYLYIY